MFVFSNLAISLDGKIAPASREFFYLGTPLDRRQMQVLRKRCDAILVGASTLRAFKKPMRIRDSRRQPLNVIVSSTLEGLAPSWEFFRDPELRRVLIVTGKVPAARLRRFEKSCEILHVDPKRVAPESMRLLEARGVRRLLVEGGGGIMWEFVKFRLIDEFHVTLTPWVLGGMNAPTLVDGEGFDSRRALPLKLKKAKRVGDEIYLTYVQGSRLSEF